MVFNGFQWFSMVFNGFQWFSMVFNGFQWFSMVFNGFQWFSMVFNGFQWFSLVFIDFQQFSTVFNGLSGLHECDTQGVMWSVNPISGPLEVTTFVILCLLHHRRQACSPKAGYIQVKHSHVLNPAIKL